jgi:predicted enzyme related to lactoylglutathione lyase
MTVHAINWFEIPATNFDQVVDFYSTILNQPIKKGEFAGMPHGFFPADEEGVTGAIVKGNGEPITGGALIYLNAGQSQGDSGAHPELWRASLAALYGNPTTGRDCRLQGY